MKAKVKILVWDMDGTIADLYGVENWLPMLRAYDPTPYQVAKPLWDMEELARLIRLAQAQGIENRVVTWLSKESTPEYDKLVREAKREWLKANGFPYDHFHGVKYGATKADSVRKYLGEDESAILFDDNAKVRAGWNLGMTVNPTTCDILEVLKSLVEG